MKGEIIRDIDYKTTNHRMIQYSTEEYKNSEKIRIESLNNLMDRIETIIDISKPDDGFYALEIQYITMNN